MEMTDKLRAAKGEALICRAYAHFVLVNIFSQQYDPNYPDDMGIPYMEKAETELDPKYEFPFPRERPAPDWHSQWPDTANSTS